MTLLGKIVVLIFIFAFALMLCIQSEKPVMVPVDEETIQESMSEETYRAFQEALSTSQPEAGIQPLAK